MRVRRRLRPRLVRRRRRRRRLGGRGRLGRRLPAYTRSTSARAAIPRQQIHTYADGPTTLHRQREGHRQGRRLRHGDLRGPRQQRRPDVTLLRQPATVERGPDQPTPSPSATPAGHLRARRRHVRHGDGLSGAGSTPPPARASLRLRASRTGRPSPVVTYSVDDSDGALSGAATVSGARRQRQPEGRASPPAGDGRRGPGQHLLVHRLRPREDRHVHRAPPVSGLRHGGR